MKRSSIVALVLAALTALCVGVGCVGVAAVGPGTLLGCETDPTPAVPAVRDDPKRVAELFPKLGEVREVHWQVREARPRTCPDLGPMDYLFDGLVSLAADPAGYTWQPTAAPAIPKGLVELAPRAVAWQVSTDFDAAMGGSFHLDPDSHTLYFHVLKG